MKHLWDLVNWFFYADAWKESKTERILQSIFDDSVLTISLAIYSHTIK